VRAAIKAAAAAGLLGERILGSRSAQAASTRRRGAFVCGRNRLIQSLEGRRGMPRPRPPYPAQSGFRGQPTLINNVETLACVPWIVRRGAAAFAALWTERSKGTKVFSLAGKIARGGLIEVPMGITLREIVLDVGGGIKGGRAFKAVLAGGPSGGCISASLAGTASTTRSSRPPGRSWARAASSSSTTATAPWTSRATSCISLRTSRAASARSAASAPGGCSRSWSGSATGRDGEATSRRSRPSARP
jgi:NADH-quinone oxidoreductase subunit F